MSNNRLSKYVCAFRGRRDSYAVPLALAEAGRLDQFITDAWSGPILRRLGLSGKLAHRYMKGIPDHRVRCLWSSTIREHWRHRKGHMRIATWGELDQEFSRGAANRARKTGADLFLYSAYAWEAFTASYPNRTPRKILFQFHPHPAPEARLLDQDLKRFPEVAHSHAEATGEKLPDALQLRNSDPWKHADTIVCASSFTRDSLLAMGADRGKCVVLPYGVDLPPRSDLENLPGDGRFKALFVGSGVQRKGLHHLLRAWECAKLPGDSELTLVCRVLDPGLEQHVARTSRVRLLRGVGASDLEKLYADSTLFVMPSLIEGFGQVYLEALAAGCPVLGTPNTALPDLGGETDGIFLTPSGDIAALAESLETLAHQLPLQKALRSRARENAESFTWERFRSGIVRIL
jgi:glycosyltransferase involved in cell wall biosynthesis